MIWEVRAEKLRFRIHSRSSVGVAMANVLKTDDEKEMLIELVRQYFMLRVSRIIKIVVPSKQTIGTR